MAEQKCGNCRREIPSASFQLHAVHCARNITLCTRCDEPIPRAEFEEHMETVHRQLECDTGCGARMEVGKMEDHKAHHCPKRTTLCRWCGTHVEMGQLTEHEDYCGSRTEKCEKCEEYIMLKNFETHTCTPPWERRLAEMRRPSLSSARKPSTIANDIAAIEAFRRLEGGSSHTSITAAASQETFSSSRRYSSSTTSSAITRSTSNSLVSTALNRSATAASVLNNSNSNSNCSESEAVLLPCEFCDQPIPSTKLLSHQAECVSPANVRPAAATAASAGSYSSRMTRAASITRSPSYSLAATASSSRVNKVVEDSSPSPRKISPSSGSSIVSRFLSGPEPKTSGSESRRVLPESPPSYEKETASSYVGRSSYLKEESRRDTRELTAATKTKVTRTEAPGLYNNADDREGLRQMLSSLRRDPMDVEDDPDNNDGTFFPCEFCGDPYPCEYLMRHQISCDLNPQPVASGNGFDYNAIKRNIGDSLGVPEPSHSRRKASGSSGSGEAESSSRESRRMSRSNSVIERSYSRSNIRASSVSRTSSFADRSYGTRTNLARQSSFTLQDYSSAARRSSIFDGVAGYSIYSSISEGLDNITSGIRTQSRRNSVTENTSHVTTSHSYSLSRQSSFSARSSVPISALMASMEASKASKDENTQVANAHINSQASAYLQSAGPGQGGFSRQNSRKEAEVDSPFGVTSGRHGAETVQRSDSSHQAPGLRRRPSLKHSESGSGYKLERKVSFHHRDQIIGDTSRSMIVDENGVPVEAEKKEKKKRTKEEKEARRKEKEEKRIRKEAKRAAREMSVDRRGGREESVPAPAVSGLKGHCSTSSTLEQVSAKLAHLQEGAGGRGPGQASTQLPANTASVTTGLPGPAANLANGHDSTALTARPEDSSRPRKGPAPQPPVTDSLVCLDTEEAATSASTGVVLREHNGGDTSASRSCSKRNSLDNKSVASLAKDLAAECAKAYELMESSLSKLTNDFSIGPFGLTPKTKKKFRGPPPAPPLQ